MNAFETETVAARPSRGISRLGVRSAVVRAAIVAMSLSTAAGPVQAADPAATCSTAKEKAAATLFSDQVACHGKAQKAGRAVDPECLAKAKNKFESAFQAAEAKGGCATANDAAAIEALIGDRSAALIAALPASTPTTTLPPSVCSQEANCPACEACSGANPDFVGVTLPHSDSDEVCKDAYEACQADPRCGLYNDCVRGCHSSDFRESCFATCASTYPAGAALQDRTYSCVVATCDPLCTFCRNSVCDPGEDHSNCSFDCGCSTQACGDGICDGFCETGTSCPTDCASRWNCDPTWYDDGECDCGCGIVDSDCADATLSSCRYCTSVGSCACYGGTSCGVACSESSIDPDNNALCIP